MWSDDPLLNPTDPVSTMGVNVCILDKEEKNIYAATTTKDFFSVIIFFEKLKILPNAYLRAGISCNNKSQQLTLLKTRGYSEYI